jgi:hypothetical protein
MPGPESDAPSTRSFAARLVRALRDPGFPVALAVGALLLFSWPFVRVPRLDLAQAWVHVFAAWALAIASLAVFARALAGPDDEGRDG